MNEIINGKPSAAKIQSHIDIDEVATALNTTHKSSDGSDHSKVVANETARNLSAYTNLDSDAQAMTKDHAYLAMTDGMVFAYGDINGGSLFQIFVGDTDDPVGAGTLIQKDEGSDKRWRSLCALVAKGEYFEVTGVGGAAYINWKSFGALSAPVDQN